MLGNVMPRHLRRHAKDRRELGNDLIDSIDCARPPAALTQLLGVDSNAVAWAIVSQADAVAIEDAPTNAGQADPPHALTVKSTAVLGRPQHLDAPQVDSEERQSGEHRQHHQAEAQAFDF